MSAQAVVSLHRLGSALRRAWLQILIGSICGWAVGTISGAFALVQIELKGVSTQTEGAALAAGAWVFFLIVLGGVIGHRLTRKE